MDGDGIPDSAEGTTPRTPPSPPSFPPPASPPPCCQTIVATSASAMPSAGASTCTGTFTQTPYTSFDRATYKRGNTYIYYWDAGTWAKWRCHEYAGVPSFGAASYISGCDGAFCPDCGSNYEVWSGEWSGSYGYSISCAQSPPPVPPPSPPSFPPPASPPPCCQTIVATSASAMPSAGASTCTGTFTQTPYTSFDRATYKRGNTYIYYWDAGTWAKWRCYEYAGVPSFGAVSYISGCDGAFCPD